MSLRVEYASRRREIWNWYWRTWRQRLWKTHVALFCSVGVVVTLHSKGDGRLSASSVLLGLACGLLAILWMPIYPMLKFKPQVRTLEVNREGISTTIGKVSAERSWKDIRSVSQEGEYIVFLGRNGNAFIVPQRAFRSTEEQQDFLSFAQNAMVASSEQTR